MRQKLEISLVSATESSAKTFVADIDRQIAELEENLHLLKTARGTVARTFGLDRREGTFIEKLVDGAKRSETEIDEESLVRELSVGRFGDPSETRVAT